MSASGYIGRCFSCHEDLAAAHVSLCKSCYDGDQRLYRLGQLAGRMETLLRDIDAQEYLRGTELGDELRALLADADAAEKG